MYLPGVIGVSTLVAVCVDFVSGSVVFKFWNKIDNNPQKMSKPQCKADYASLTRRCRIK